jgi:hypothetical protein
MGKVRRTYNVSARLVGLMAKGKRRVVRKGWSFKEDRRLSELAGSGKTLEQIVKAMNRTPDFVRNRSLRLGLSIKSKSARRK